ncbi:MAG: ABC transporter substrate-binding protein [Ilumatobacteraceae bacterium]|nr:ABC transporter substrate-binding protein [Ilumatobacteraceae bacterium]
MRIKLVAGVVAGFVLVAAACGDDGESADTTSVAASPVTTAGEPTPATSAPSTGEPCVPLDGGPQAIVSLSPTATEMVFAIGAGDLVVAVDSLSTYPPETAEVVTDLSAFEPNVEAIAGYEPDLVLSDGTNPDLLTQLDTLGIARWEGPAAMSFSDIYDQLRQLGEATGCTDGAERVVAEMEAEILEILAATRATDTSFLVYHELDPTYFSVTSDTFIGYVYNQLGLRNVADLAEGDGGPYPQLNAEFIVSSDPEMIFLADTKCCGETAESVAARPGWSEISAVVNDAVVELDDDIASRWGPRVVDLMAVVADEVAALAERTAG